MFYRHFPALGNAVRRAIACVALAIAFAVIAGCGASGGGEAPGGGGGDYPSQDIEFIVPYEPGGGYDSWARLLAPFIAEHLPNDVNVVVRNVPGASGQTGANQMFAAQPDGSQIQIFNLTGLAAGQIGGEANFELSEFTYLARVARDPQVVTVAGDSDIENIEDLKAQAPIQQALTGFTSSDGVNTVIVYDVFDIEYNTVLHDGNSEARLSIVRGDTDAGISSLESVLGDLQSGDLKAILYISDEKPAEGEPGHEEVGDTQTIAEAGHPELATGLEAQRVIAAPPGLPDDIKSVLDQAIQDALADPEFLAQAEESELTPSPLNSEEATEVVNEVIDTLTEFEEPIQKAIQENQ